MIDTNLIYKQDLLNRNLFCQSVMRFCDKFAENENGLSLTINGGYGSGKTTVLGFLEKEFLNSNYLVINHNCWKSTAYDDVLLSIMFSIRKSLLAQLGTTEKEKVKKFFSTAIKFILRGANAVTEAMTGTNVKDTFVVDDAFSVMEEYEKEISDFRRLLESIASNSRKVVILFDEIDRCSPVKAMEILERVHHILGIKNVVSIIAVDNNQLEKSVENVYGKQISVCGFLSKFIHYEFDLPTNCNLNIFTSMLNELPPPIFVSIAMAFGMQIREIVKMLNIYLLIHDDKANDRATNIICIIMIAYDMKDKAKYEEFFCNLKYDRSSLNKVEEVLLEQSAAYKIVTDLRKRNIYANTYDTKWIEEFFFIMTMEFAQINESNLLKFLEKSELRKKNDSFIEFITFLKQTYDRIKCLS